MMTIEFDFNKITKSSEREMVTTDNQTAIKLLTANSITVIPTSTGLIVNKDALSQIQQILFKNQVWLRELVPNVPSFEKKIITVLKERRENSNGK